MPAHDLKPAAVRSCPACDAGVIAARNTYAFRRVYLCPSHQDKWDTADMAEREREQKRAAR